MDNLEDDLTMLNALKSVAYINVKKIPGRTGSNSNEIEQAYREHKHVLLKQIEYYNPDIIIGASTLYNFFSDFGFTREQMISNDSFNYISKEGKIYIEATHPAQYSISQQKYCDNIINAVKNWVTNNDSDK